jgi:hypothetical protein
MPLKGDDVNKKQMPLERGISFFLERIVYFFFAAVESALDVGFNFSVLYSSFNPLITSCEISMPGPPNNTSLV